MVSRTNRKYEVRPLGCDWALDIPLGDTTVVLYFNSRNNAELVKAILEWEDNHPNEAAPYQPTLTPQNEWVSVEERLPPNMDDVIVVVQNNGECWTVTGYYSGMSKRWYAMLNGQDTQMDVLWWMPFPAPPTKEE